MGYETTLHIVQEYTHDQPGDWPICGGELAVVEMRCLGDGPLADLISASENDKWGLYARNCDQSQEAADFLREIAELDDDVTTHFSLSAEEIKKLSNHIEDGFVTRDQYDAPLAVMDLDDVIRALHAEMVESDYRRLGWALAIMQAIKHTFKDGAVKVIAFGH